MTESLNTPTMSAPRCSRDTGIVTAPAGPSSERVQVPPKDADVPIPPTRRTWYDRLAEILNQTDEISSELILNEIEETDAEMAAQIKQKMFVFEDLVLVEDRGFQKLLRKVGTVELAIALKAASEEVKEKVFKNMSERAGSVLQEEMEDLGPVRMKEVSDAQQTITAIIQEMEVKGEIIISGRRGEEIID